MGVLAGLIGLSLAALPVVEESVRQLTPVPVVGAAFEGYTLLTIPPSTRPPEHAFYRLRVHAPRIWLDGALLRSDGVGEFDLLNLRPKVPSRVVVAGRVEAAQLIETPRVFVSEYELGDREARLWVRNTLDNTVNVYGTVAGQGGSEWSGSGTVPPGTTQLLILSGGAGMGEAPWRIMVEKQEEAMEGAYRFLKVVRTRTGRSVNSSRKP